MASISKKGGKFEKEFCKQLSRWWTHANRDDVFYSTSGSGNRATVRYKRNQCTENSCGDVSALGEIGFPFINYFMTEVKRGYGKKLSFIDIVDAPGKKTILIKKWIIKAEKEKERNFRKSIFLVIKRDYKQTFVILPSQTIVNIYMDSLATMEDNYIRFSVNGVKYYALLLTTFFKHVTPQTIKNLAGFYEIRRRKNVHQKASR